MGSKDRRDGATFIRADRAVMPAAWGVEPAATMTLVADETAFRRTSMMRRRRPLLRGAMVGGAAYYAGRKIAQGDQREYEQEERLSSLEYQQTPMPAQQYAPPQQQYAPPQAEKNPQQAIEQLTELKKLLDAGVLTQAEFDVQKTKILQNM
jgi:Short C-terminal domain